MARPGRWRRRREVHGHLRRDLPGRVPDEPVPAHRPGIAGQRHLGGARLRRGFRGGAAAVHSAHGAGLPAAGVWQPGRRLRRHHPVRLLSGLSPGLREQPLHLREPDSEGRRHVQRLGVRRRRRRLHRPHRLRQLHRGRPVQGRPPVQPRRQHGDAVAHRLRVGHPGTLVAAGGGVPHGRPVHEALRGVQRSDDLGLCRHPAQGGDRLRLQPGDDLGLPVRALRPPRGLDRPGLRCRGEGRLREDAPGGPDREPVPARRPRVLEQPVSGLDRAGPLRLRRPRAAGAGEPRADDGPGAERREGPQAVPALRAELAARLHDVGAA
mmetsp:Transcript_19923/g.59712  ORF Transcript_19923/g.59712 Transcript_19923/m.59712 type:complete len:323 (+) Transcript_19923:1273-2241(+)